MNTLTLNTRVQRRTDLLSSDLDGDTVMFDMVSSNYFGMDEIGGRIWQLLETPSSISTICDLLCEEYEVDAVTCQQDVTTFVQQLLEQKLITII